MVIAHVPELTATADVCEQLVYAQFEYDPESGAPTANIPIQSPARGLGMSEKVTVDRSPPTTLDGLALTCNMGVGVTVGPITVTTFEIPLSDCGLAAKIRNS